MASSVRETFPAMTQLLLEGSERRMEIVSFWKIAQFAWTSCPRVMHLGIADQRAAARWGSPIVGRAPSCFIMPRASQLVLESMIFPPARWWMVIPSTETFLFVGGTPMKSPLWVPESVQQATTLSFSAMVSSMVKRRSGKPARKRNIWPLYASGPTEEPDRAGAWSA